MKCHDLILLVNADQCITYTKRNPSLILSSVCMSILPCPSLAHNSGYLHLIASAALLSTQTSCFDLSNA